MLGYKLDFNSCAIREGFCKSSHIYILLIIIEILSSCVTDLIVVKCMCTSDK